MNSVLSKNIFFPEEIIVLGNETGAKEQLNSVVMDAMATRTGMKNAFKQTILS